MLIVEENNEHVKKAVFRMRAPHSCINEHVIRMRAPHIGAPKLCSKCWQRPLLEADAALNNEEIKTLSTLYHRHAAVSGSSNGIVDIPTNGRPTRVMMIPSADVPSSEASARTLARRSSTINTVIEGVV